MTDQALGVESPGTLRRVLDEFFRREPLFSRAAVCLAALALPTGLAILIDERTLLGSNVWVKPLKFELALAIYLGTLAWLAGWLPTDVVRSRRYRAFSVAVVVAIAAEMTWIGGAAALGVPSHFNTASPSMRFIYGLMGALAVLLTSSALVYGLIILGDRASRIEPTLRMSTGVGLILAFTLTVVVAGYMASRAGHGVGSSSTHHRGPGLLGWSPDSGDLRVAHFFATHAMHVLPAFGFLAGRLLAPRTACRAAISAAALYVAFVAWTFAEAVAGRPFPVGF